MGCHCLYLVPTTAVAGPRRIARKAVSILTDQGIIWAAPARNPEFSPGHFSFRCGENGRRAFAVEADAQVIPFETCYLFGAKHPDVVPQFPAVYPKCSRCGTNVSSEFYAFVNDENVEEPFQCPACGNNCRIDSLVDDVGIFITTLYLCFDDTKGLQVDAEWLHRFSEQLGIGFMVKEYWYT